MKYEALWLGTWPPLAGEASASARPQDRLRPHRPRAYPVVLRRQPHRLAAGADVPARDRNRMIEKGLIVDHPFDPLVLAMCGRRY
jgi:hypothetical protein